MLGYMKKLDLNNDFAGEENCPVALASLVVGDVWVLLITRDLLEGPKRFNELLDSLKTVSSATLTKRLKMMESEGIITREIFPVIPPRVEYTLTAQGLDLAQVVDAIRVYGNKYHVKNQA